MFTDCLIYYIIKYHKFISVVVIELSVRCLNTGPEDRLAVLSTKRRPCVDDSSQLVLIGKASARTLNTYIN